MEKAKIRPLATPRLNRSSPKLTCVISLRPGWHPTCKIL